VSLLIFIIFCTIIVYSTGYTTKAGCSGVVGEGLKMKNTISVKIMAFVFEINK